jgi:adenine-specific DNA-methyltransferase
MARKKINTADTPVESLALDYRHPNAKRKNIPPAGLAAQGTIRKEQKHHYAYNPHLPPVLRFDPKGNADKLPALLQTAKERALTDEEAKLLADALRNHCPWLEWSGKREEQECVVDPVALHIHERISTQAILKVAERQDVQRSLFADPLQDLRDALKFYEHDVDWSNRMILGDSLQVMASLARREALAGRVQMIYIDPPYGIKYASNFQSEVGKRDVKDKEQDLTREPEMIKAYRDTWTLGVHSYLAYLRDRFYAAKELLADSGSIFVQISDENVHLVRGVLDDVFGGANFVGQIVFAKTSGYATNFLTGVCDYILWFGKNRASTKFRQLYTTKNAGEAGAAKYNRIITRDGITRSITEGERSGESALPKDARFWVDDNLTSQGNPLVEYEYRGSKYAGTYKTTFEGISRLAVATRLYEAAGTLRYIRHLEDFQAVAYNAAWMDIGGVQSRTDPKVYVVQTSTEAIKRCLLMTTDTGDLVLDPTCGSGTTAYVAEQWGRRWITIDTSRVALAIARQRLLTAKYEYYSLRPTSAEDVSRSPNGAWLHDPAGQIEGSATFDCKTVPHVTLKSIAQNQALDRIFDKWQPVTDKSLKQLNDTLIQLNTKELRTVLQGKLVAKIKSSGKRSVTDADERRWILPPNLVRRNGYTTVLKEFAGWYEWEVPFDTDPDWPEPLSNALAAYREVWRAKMDEVDAAVAARADQEELIDDPHIQRNIVRVSGPFTVEGVIPAEESIELDEPSPITEQDEPLETFDETPETVIVQNDPVNAETYVDKMIKLLLADGVRFPDNKIVKLSRLERTTVEGLHAEGEWERNDKSDSVAVTFGPQYGPLTAMMVEEAMRFANRRGYDDLVFAAFSFDGEAQAVIQEESAGRLRLHMAQIRPDVNMVGLLKTTASSQLFTVSGTPRVYLRDQADGEFVIEMEGVDIYDPVENRVRSAGKDKIAAWFIDGDYDGRTFCITQAFFPDKKAWEKLSKALTNKLNPEVFETFSGSVSLPFAIGKHRRAAVKVVDPRGNEVMRVFKLSQDGRAS